MMENIWKRCNKCGCSIDDNDDHIEAVKWGTRVYYCKDHISYAENFMKWYGEIIEIKTQKVDLSDVNLTETWREKLHNIISDSPEIPINICIK